MDLTSNRCLRQLLVLSLLSVTRLAAGQTPVEPSTETGVSTTRIDFSHDIVPILKQHCIGCHGGEKAEGGFSLNTRRLMLESDVVTVGQPDKSRLIELIESRDVDDQMPPRDLPRLSPDQVAALKRWVQEGAGWEDGFSFGIRRYEPPLKPRRPQLPAAVEGRSQPIDRILDHQLRQQGIVPGPGLNDAQFLRRVTFDLIGLPPTEQQLAEFLEDSSADKRARAVDRLLSSDREYAEHWISFWNDLLRNAYAGTGYIDGGRKQLTGWLYQALLTNKSYDQFVRELIAASPESEGFIRGIKWRGNVNASQVREIQFSQNVSQVFLGINTKCASCHDSFIDRWTLDEAYALAAVYSTRELEIHRCDQPTGRIARAGWLFPELGQIDPEAEQPARLRQLAELVTHPENGRFARTIANRIWHRLMGRGIVHPVDAMHTEPFNADLLDYLATSLVDHNYDLKQLLREIVMSESYQTSSIVLADDPERERFAYRGPIARRMTAEQFLDAIRAVSGLRAQPDAKAFKVDGRGQGGQLLAVLASHGGGETWDDHPLRSALMPRDPLQASLGRPNREQVVTTRPALLTTLEAITLSNGPELAQLLDQAATKLLGETGSDSRTLICWTYLRALCRPPTDAEQDIAMSILGECPTAESTSDFLWVVFMLPEFQLIH